LLQTTVAGLATVVEYMQFHTSHTKSAYFDLGVVKPMGIAKLYPS